MSPRLFLSTPFPHLKSVLSVMLVAAAFCLCFQGNLFVVHAQETGDDLSVPGLTDNVVESATADAFTGANSGSGENREDGTSLLKMIGKGGAAMWLLALFSIALIALATYCLMDFREKNFLPAETLNGLREDLEKTRLGRIVELATEPDAPTVTRMHGAVCEYIHENGYTADDTELHRNLIAEAGQRSNRGRARLVNYFAVIAQAAPMAGLLGTVFGMIKAFGSLGSEVNNPGVLANHISEALVTTASGLIIALPAIFLYFYLRDRLEELVSNCEEATTRSLPLLRMAAFAESIREEEALAGRENVYDDSIKIEYDKS